jgi:transposase
MPEGMRWVGLDVHAYESACAVFDAGTGEVDSCRRSGRPHELLEWLERQERPFRAVYEAGPTGYGLARGAAERGIDVAVCAPGHIARRPGDRVKTDKRDALRLARLLAAGELVLVAVPPEEHERLRDLVRCREDLRGDLMRARHRISKFLLRRELYPPAGAGGSWTGRHRDWLTGLRFDDRASELCLADYLHAHDVLLARRERLDESLGALARESPWSATIARLRCLRGIDTLSALGLCAEVSDWGRLLQASTGGLPRARPLGELVRGATPPGLDHQGRLRPRPPAAGRGGPPLPPCAAAVGRARAAPARPGSLGGGLQLARPAAPLRPLATAADRTRQGCRHHRGRGGARARRLLLGARHQRLTHRQHRPRLPGRHGSRPFAHTTRPRGGYEPSDQAPLAPRRRPCDEQRSCASERGYQPDRASRTAHPCRTGSRAPHRQPPPRRRARLDASRLELDVHINPKFLRHPQVDR